MERVATSYELYVFDSEQVPDLDGARLAFDDAPYYDRSRPASDEAARKWRVARALQASDRELSRVDAGEALPESRRHLQLGHHDARQSLRLDLFDEAVEIVLELPAGTTAGSEAVTRLFRCLSVLQREGFGCVYDPQLERLLDIEADEGAVMAALMKSGARESGPSISGDGTRAARGPADVARPWWKFW